MTVNGIDVDVPASSLRLVTRTANPTATELEAGANQDKSSVFYVADSTADGAPTSQVRLSVGEWDLWGRGSYFVF